MAHKKLDHPITDTCTGCILTGSQVPKIQFQTLGSHDVDIRRGHVQPTCMLILKTATAQSIKQAPLMRKHSSGNVK